MRESFRANKAITLIALVITIIVLLILAGVTIATLTGDNGLLTKAGQTKNTTLEAEGLERIQVEVLGSYNNNGQIDTNLLRRNLQNITGLTMEDNQPILDSTTIDLPVVVKINENRYLIKVDGTVTEASVDYLALREGDTVYYKDSNNKDIECTVLYDSIGNYGVQIIPRNPVGKKELGNGTGNSNYSTDLTHFITAKASYNDAINILNTSAQTYVASNLNLVDIAESSRCVGSLPSNPNKKNISKYSNSYNYFSSYNDQFETPESDTTYKASNIENYIADWEQLETLGIKTITDTTNGNYYWLASRDYSAGSQNTNFGVRGVNSYGALWYDYLCYVELGGRVPSKSFENGLRPCITLKSNIKVIEMNSKKYLGLE